MSNPGFSSSVPSAFKTAKCRRSNRKPPNRLGNIGRRIELEFPAGFLELGHRQNLVLLEVASNPLTCLGFRLAAFTFRQVFPKTCCVVLLTQYFQELAADKRPRRERK